MARQVQTEAQRLRKFALVMTIALGALGGLGLWRERQWAVYLLAVAGAFLLSGLLAPRALRPVERVWMALARVLQTVVTTIILTLTFFLVMTPIGLIVRMTGKDLLGMRAAPDEQSYWIPVDPDGPASRHETPY